MPVSRKSKHYTDEKKYTVYVILHPNTKEFFIHFSTTSALRNTMKQHYTLNNIYTKDMFEAHKETIYPPEMYALDENEKTLAECFDKKILWIRYFLDNNFIPLNHADDISAANNLFEENLDDYKIMSQIKLEEILSKNNRRFARYGRERMEKNLTEKSGERKQMKFFCSEEECEIIKKNAKKSKQTISAFIREVSVNTIFVEYNYNAVMEHTEQINNIKSELNAVINMLVMTNQAFPADIEKIISLLKELDHSEKTMLQRIVKERQLMQKHIKKLL